MQVTQMNLIFDVFFLASPLILLGIGIFRYLEHGWGACWLEFLFALFLLCFVVNSVREMGWFPASGY